ncbi:DUF2971 domain-containing protein [Rathayibacter sp. VKM Ac-2754]|uniref:DUF2971 domain-containing protein n=1 Tax=Rathayibacter sp. VKM Ac-2754 TaxID=2609251 RepID=UPI00135A7394|nr:DUF2971 domain-containing protein [Rathayibacter sp. VKM Ac-2754]MWV58219.1 DUF2971 domain-containing protein [Rathayibacter sp. VKM Ac-2754]
MYELETRTGPVPSDLMWHYTDAAGALGMLKSREFWASHTFHLNDTEELLQFHRLMSTALQLEAQKPENDDVVIGMLHAAEYLDNMPYHGNCIVSFSSDPDSLSQWRGYTGPGQGYALGFDRSMFEDIYQWKLRECIYDAGTASDLMNGIISRALARIRTGAYNEDPHWLRVYDAIGSEVGWESPVLKHKAFAEEREIRLIGSVESERMEVRNGRRGIMGYKSLAWPVDADGFYPLREVILGPGATSETVFGIRMALDNDLGFKRFVKVYASEAPYRT